MMGDCNNGAGDGGGGRRTAYGSDIVLDAIEEGQLMDRATKFIEKEMSAGRDDGGADAPRGADVSAGLRDGRARARKG